LDASTPLFVYGTLRSEELRASVLGHPGDGVAAIARGHRVVFYPGRTYPALISAPGHDAAGVVVAGLTPGDLAQLDIFEGNEYERRSLTVRVDGRLHTAQVYWPLTAIAADAPTWRYEDWLARHAAGMIAAKGAAALREQLIAEGDGP
jgi:gamma-glutamylcyclotransferase (GGCT)/AIG2-like uncharacterized protein YtfP